MIPVQHAPTMPPTAPPVPLVAVPPIFSPILIHIQNVCGHVPMAITLTQLTSHAIPVLLVVTFVVDSPTAAAVQPIIAFLIRHAIIHALRNISLITHNVLHVMSTA